MMRYVIGLLLILAAVWGIRKLIAEWDSVQAKKDAEEGRAPQVEKAAPGVLPGLPPNLEVSLQAARKQGASGLKNWLGVYRRYVADPRLAEIELDYVILSGSGSIKEARQIFAAVKQRTSTNSPVYPRIKQLERTYQ
jgi:hypothetical protein